MTKFSIFIKWITLPLFMPIYALIFVMFTPVTVDFSNQYVSLFQYTFKSKQSILIIFFFFGAILPALSYSIMSRFGMISSVEMKSQTERRGPILLMLIYCVALFFLIYFQSNRGQYISKFILGLPLAGAAVAGIIGLINLKTKVSLHGSGVGILCGFVSAFALSVSSYPIWPVYTVFAIAGLVLFTRLYLSAHTPSQVYIGFSVGFVLTFIINFYIIHIL